MYQKGLSSGSAKSMCERCKQEEELRNKQIFQKLEKVFTIPTRAVFGRISDKKSWKQNFRQGRFRVASQGIDKHYAQVHTMAQCTMFKNFKNRQRPAVPLWHLIFAPE